MSAGSEEAARPATVEDLKRLPAALSAEQVDYVLIGGYALHALGYQRATVDIDLLLRPDRDQGERLRRTLLTLPDKGWTPAGLPKATQSVWPTPSSSTAGRTQKSMSPV
jgi:hypothetical protein